MHIIDQEAREYIGKKIEELRNLRGLTREELAEMAQKTPNNILRIEQGKYSVDVDMIQQIVKPMGGKLDVVW